MFIEPVGIREARGVIVWMGQYLGKECGFLGHQRVLLSTLKGNVAGTITL